MARMIEQIICLPHDLKHLSNNHQVSGTICNLALTMDKQKMEEANQN
jgi:hypothetical protein